MDEPQRLQQEDSPAENSSSDSDEGYWKSLEEKIVDTFNIAANFNFLVQEASNIDFSPNIDFSLRGVKNGYRIPHLQSIERSCGIPFSLIEKETGIPCEEAYERLARPLITNGYGYRQEVEEYEVPYEEEEKISEESKTDEISEESKTNETRTTAKVGLDVQPLKTKSSWIGRSKLTKNNTLSTQKRFSFFRRRSFASF